MKKFTLLLAFPLISGIVNAQTAFGPQQVITTNASGAMSVFAADLDNDGDMDVLSASQVDDKIGWYENDGFGNFGSQKIITTNADGAALVFASDLDNDGDNDVLSASYIDGIVAWYENNGAGQFGPQKIICNFSEPGQISIFSIDLDNDNYKDVLVAQWGSTSGEGAVCWFKNLGNGTFSSTSIYRICSFH